LEILAEAQVLADQGCVEITLLGQTVNSYRYQADGRLWRMADLLESLHQIDGLRRIKFVTNYPKDMTVDLLDTIARLPKVSPYLHVPAQSGSDPILQRMKRGYTVDDYLAMMDRIGERLPQASVSSDFIVGFSGETDEDFQRSIDLVKRCQFKNSFIFKYSVRPGTKAAERLPDDIPAEVKAARNQAMLEVQDAVSLAQQQQWIGRTVEVLVEGPSKHAIKRGVAQSGEAGEVTQMTGRTLDDRIVVWDGNLRQAGQFVPVRIVEASPFTLVGTIVTRQLVGIGGFTGSSGDGPAQTSI
jgi:tRNA-2-methylthio-N6-dimethylallyladenosine synthase